MKKLFGVLLIAAFLIGCNSYSGKRPVAEVHNYSAEILVVEKGKEVYYNQLFLRGDSLKVENYVEDILDALDNTFISEVEIMYSIEQIEFESIW